ncbi:MAG TPA: gliding motility lipoprotein GldH [Tenuifilaceae bacterium]|nr:gliding motility lipoprotein GldH [Tenuifilaceae bacterium]
MNRLLFSLVVAFLALASCHEVALYDSNYDVKGNVWSVDSTARFLVSVSDTVSPHHIFVNVRNTTDYPYSNLFLFIHTTSPAGASLRDTLECTLADKKGNWLGKGFGALRDSRIPYKRYVRFPEQGIFTIEIEHGMRTRNLQGIASVCLRVEKAK